MSKQTQIVKQTSSNKPKPAPEADTRTPSGKKLPW